MKLLFDADLSPSLVKRLHDLFPGSDHVLHFGIDKDDEAIWTYALKFGYALVTKDTDFQSRAALQGHPPRVICIQTGNCSTQDIELRMRSGYQLISEFLRNDPSSILFLR